MIPLHDIVLICLASKQAVEIWRHSRFWAFERDLCENGLFPFGQTPAIQRIVALLCRSRYLQSALTHSADFLVDLLQCGWCLSVWVAGFLFCLRVAMPMGGEFVLIALACSYVANLLHDIEKSFRT